MNALVDESTAALALTIGVRIREERQSRNWPLDQRTEELSQVQQGTIMFEVPGRRRDRS